MNIYEQANGSTNLDPTGLTKVESKNIKSNSHSSSKHKRLTTVILKLKTFTMGSKKTEIESIKLAQVYRLEVKEDKFKNFIRWGKKE